MKVSLEFAHSVVDAVNATDVHRSASVASTLVKALEEAGHQIAACVLLDDKRIRIGEREVAAKRFLSDLGGPPVSYFCFERDLVDYSDDLLALLDGRRKRRVARYIKSHLDRYQTLPCFVDIAIWHLLRLGVLIDHHGHMTWLDERADRPTADVVVSVLGDQLSDPELLARRDILDQVSGLNTDARIVNVYYPETFSECVTFDLGALVPTALKELLNVHDSRH